MNWSELLTAHMSALGCIQTSRSANTCSVLQDVPRPNSFQRPSRSTVTKHSSGIRTLFNVVGGGCETRSIGFFVVSLRQRMNERAKSQTNGDVSVTSMDRERKADSSVVEPMARSSEFHWAIGMTSCHSFRRVRQRR